MMEEEEREASSIHLSSRLGKFLADVVRKVGSWGREMAREGRVAM